MKQDPYAEEIVTRIERYFFWKEFRGVWILTSFLLIIIALQWHAKANYTLHPLSCEELREQYKRPDASCSELQSIWEAAVSQGSFAD
jgi:hypothetical protein